MQRDQNLKCFVLAISSAVKVRVKQLNWFLFDCENSFCRSLGQIGRVAGLEVIDYLYASVLQKIVAYNKLKGVCGSCY